MSATRWSSCPRCLRRAQIEHDDRVKAVMDSYGKVPVDQFDADRAALPERPMADGDEGDCVTFREDFEACLFEDRGVLDFEYRGECSECGLTVKTGVKEDFYDPSAEALDGDREGTE